MQAMYQLKVPFKIKCTNSTFRSGSRFALKGIAAIRSWNSVMNAANYPKSGYDLKCCDFFFNLYMDSNCYEANSNQNTEENKGLEDEI